jgi:hypothetical protein
MADCVFVLVLGKEEGKNWNKSERNLLNCPQNLMHREVQSDKNQRRKFV